MEIDPKDWHEASGRYAIDDGGRVWQIIGFIDRPTVILDPVGHDGVRQYQVMGSPNSKRFRRLVIES